MQAANKISRPFKLQLKAGVPQTIEQESEFVFVEQGRDLVIRCDSVIHDGVQRGAKLRPSSPFKRMTVTSVFDQTVVLRAGWGDWDYLIVSGELNVSAYVETRGNGQAKSLPMAVTKTVGVDSLGETEDVGNTTLFTGPASAHDDAEALFYWDGKFYGISRTTVFEFSENSTDGVWDATYALTGDAVDGSAPSGIDGPRGAAVRSDGRVFFVAGTKVYSFAIGVWVLRTEFLGFGNGTYQNPQPGLALIQDRYLLAYQSVNDNADASDDSVLVFDTISGGLNTVSVDASANPTGTATGGLVQSYDGKVYVTNNGSGQWYEVEVTPTTAKLLATGYTAEVTVAPRAFSPDGRFCAYATTSSFALKILQSRTIYGRLYVQDGADTATRKYVALTEKPNYAVRGAGYLFTGNIVGVILGAYGYTADYLDFLTELKYSDGYMQRTLGSGTQSFALRGLDDFASVYLEGEVAFKILPEFFDQ